jgi:predicted membrane-bound spermidine synthase
MAFRPTRSGAVLAFVLLLFFASGFAALLYQTIWQRMLGFFSGVDVYSVTITVAAFMAGLGCGSLVGGHLADRLSAKSRLLAFAIAEGVIALFALSSKWLYYDLLYLRWSSLAASPFLLALVLFVSLLIPTFCMGMTLPILAKTFTDRIEVASSIVGYLYGVNTLGAAIGALITPWILLRNFGFEHILQLGAALNAICAIGALFVWWMVAGGATLAPTQVVTSETPRIPESSGFPIRVWMLIYALSGFIALALEIVWFRLLGVFQKSTAFTFPTLLAVYLGGLALGVLVGVPLARRVQRPAVTFLALQSGITLYAGAMFALLLHHVNRRAFLEPLWVYLRGYEPVNAADISTAIPLWFAGAEIAPALAESARFGIVLYFVLPFVLIAPATLLMGASFPVLQKLIQNNPMLLGRRVGWLQTLNIAGSLLGAVVVGWSLLGWLGSSGTLKLLVLLGGIFLCLAAWQITRKRFSRLASLAISIIVVSWIAFLIPPAPKLWAKLHGATTRAIIAREGASGLAVLKGHPSGFDKDVVWVFTNGLGQSWLPYGSVHTQIGLLAIALHPRPETVAVIGLGSGDTAYSLGGSPHTRELTCIEIVDGNHDALKELAPRMQYPALDALLQDSRIKWVFTDGRAYILRSSRQFDVIEADALRPNSAYSGNLYSSEYFQMLKTRLKPDGLAVTWVPTDRVLASFLAVFPHAVVVDGIAIGSQQPISTETEAIQSRMADPFTTEYYRRIGKEWQPLLANLLSGQYKRYSPEGERPAVRDLNSDLFPKDEYMIPPQP